MQKKWYKNKIFIILICLVLTVIGTVSFVLAKYGVPDVGDLYMRNSRLISYLPDFLNKSIYNFSRKQGDFSWQSYRNNIHVKNFLRLCPNGCMSISGYGENEGRIICWAIVYNRYYLTMEVPFKRNLMKTGIASHEDPSFELLELNSITNGGSSSGYNPKDGVIYQFNMRGERLEFVPEGEKKKFGMKIWELLQKNIKDLEIVFPGIIRDKPLTVVYDYSQAEKSAEQGSSEAIRFLARAYYSGKTVPKDYVKAMKWMKKLADIDYLYDSRWAAFFVGDLYHLGLGTKKDDIEAVKWFKKSTLKQYPPAYFQLGQMYYYGFGVEKNILEAEKWYQKGAELKHPESCNTLAYTWVERGEKLSEAKKLIDIALARHPNNSNFLDTLGWIYYKQGKYEKAVRELEQSVVIRPNTVVLDHLGDAYSKLGKQAKAIKSWKEAIELANEKEKKLKVKIQEKLK